MNIETNQKDKAKERSVLLFSGGMDSFIMAYLLKPDVLLYCEHGNKYGHVEAENIVRLQMKGLLHTKVSIDRSLQLGKFERDDAIIPLRNLLLLSIATYYGELLYMGAVHGDRTLDKSEAFLKRTVDMFDFLYQDQHWCKERKYNIQTPYKHYTKTALVAEYLQAGGPEKGLLDSYSCYSGQRKPCGHCKSCFRKWVALKNNEINTSHYFENDPSQAPWLKEVLPLLENNQWRGREDHDIKLALQL